MASQPAPDPGKARRVTTFIMTDEEIDQLLVLAALVDTPCEGTTGWLDRLVTLRERTAAMAPLLDRLSDALEEGR